MYYRGHLLVGLLAGVFFVWVSSWLFGWWSWSAFNGLMFLFVVFISSLVLDVDHNKSFLHLHYKRLFILLGSLSLVLGVLSALEVLASSWMSFVYLSLFLLVMIGLFNRTTRQRGWLHSWYSCLLLGVVIGFLSWSVAWGFLASFVCYSHLLADGMFY